MQKKVETFSHNLRFLMKIRKISQTQLAKDLRITRSTVSKVVKGLQDPRLTWVKGICDKYSVNYQWLTERKVGE